MALSTYLTEAADAAGIELLITNSKERIETQLNSLSRESDSPIMLINWDLETTYKFNDNGFLDNPATAVVCLLMKKAEDLSKDELQATAEEMEALFQVFLQKLYSILAPVQRNQNVPITSPSSKNLPAYGMGKHSGILGKFTVSKDISNC
jgi:hypothetical protein